MMKIRKAVMTYDKYYFCNESGESVLDDETARLMNMTTEEYKEFMLKNFNCIRDKKLGQLRFVGKEEATEALDYINSILVAEKLTLGRG